MLFVAGYKVEVHGPHEVSFVLPKEVSRLEMIKEAYALVGDSDLVETRVLNAWEEDVGFTAVASASQRIHIDGHVEGGDEKTREKQEAFLRAQGRQMPSLEDLAAAFVAHYMATGEPLFGSYQDRGFSYTVRAAGGALRFFTYGLGADGVDDRNSREQVAVAAHVRPAGG